MKQPANKINRLFYIIFKFKRVLGILGQLRHVLSCLAGRTFLFPMTFIFKMHNINISLSVTREILMCNLTLFISIKWQMLIPFQELTG